MRATVRTSSAAAAATLAVLGLLTGCSLGGYVARSRRASRTRPWSSRPTTPGRCPRACSRSSPQDRLPRQGRAQRRRRPADEQARAHQGVADRRHGLRHRQHVRLARRRPGDPRAVHPEGAARLRAEVRPRRTRPRPTGSPPSTTATSASTSTTSGSAATTSRRRAPSTTWRDPRYRGLFVTPGRHQLLARSGVPARHHRGVRRPLAGVLAQADGQRHQDHLGLVRRLRGRLHRRRWPRRPADRAVLRVLTAVHDPRGRSRRRRPAACSTPASGRSSTPAC